jgi:hypothetical protein
MNYKNVTNTHGKVDCTVVAGDLNVRTGNKPVLDITGNNGKDVLNSNGKSLIDLCAFNKLRITNTYFRHKDIHLGRMQK